MTGGPVGASATLEKAGGGGAGAGAGGGGGAGGGSGGGGAALSQTSNGSAWRPRIVTSRSKGMNSSRSKRSL